MYGEIDRGRRRKIERLKTAGDYIEDEDLATAKRVLRGHDDIRISEDTQRRMAQRFVKKNPFAGCQTRRDFFAGWRAVSAKAIHSRCVYRSPLVYGEGELDALLEKGYLPDLFFVGEDFDGTYSRSVGCDDGETRALNFLSNPNVPEKYQMGLVDLNPDFFDTEKTRELIETYKKYQGKLPGSVSSVERRLDQLYRDILKGGESEYVEAVINTAIKNMRESESKTSPLPDDFLFDMSAQRSMGVVSKGIMSASPDPVLKQLLGFSGDLLGMRMTVEGSKMGFNEFGKKIDASTNCMTRKLESFDSILGKARARNFSSVYLDRITAERAQRRFPYTFGMVTNILEFLKMKGMPLRVLYTVSDDPSDRHGLGNILRLKREKGMDEATFVKIGTVKKESYENKIIDDIQKPVYRADNIEGFQVYLANRAEISKQEAYLGPEGVLDLCREYDWVQRSDGEMNKILRRGQFTDEEIKRGLVTLHKRLSESIGRLESKYGGERMRKVRSYGLLQAERENTLKLLHGQEGFAPGYYIGQTPEVAAGPYLQVMEEAIRNMKKGENRPVHNLRTRIFGVTSTEPQVHEGYLLPGDIPNERMFAELERKAINDPSDYASRIAPGGRYRLTPRRIENEIMNKVGEFGELFARHRNK